jgi:chemotaxis receptor (MCP) glutamine deamidase CheD
VSVSSVGGGKGLTTKHVMGKEVTLYIGGFHASEEPTLIKTLLGSCIAVCLHDPVARVGGMNHFMLPRGGTHAYAPDASRFGVHAMDCLIGAMMKAGADRRRFVAKIFGGAHVLDMKESLVSVPQQNIDFIRTFLSAEGFPVLSEDLGGYQPRHVQYFSHTGRARIKRVSSVQSRSRLLSREQQGQVEAPRFGDITLFD